PAVVVGDDAGIGHEGPSALVAQAHGAPREHEDVVLDRPRVPEAGVQRRTAEGADGDSGALEDDGVERVGVAGGVAGHLGDATPDRVVVARGQRPTRNTGRNNRHSWSMRRSPLGLNSLIPMGATGMGRQGAKYRVSVNGQRSAMPSPPSVSVSSRPWLAT